ncbi:cysteine--tRNA ligase [Gammaproteobacteria bacterium]|nr:cysteine--tRNA ligase [Gammaproteobacteria bacterium]MDA7857500.1 cysteine--tRNA ligase [Gammaproteobacteria bacterium]MDA8861397.1 cysteine--tRNA ligase [Gammaproteobacteria bacterium]MDA9001049.1 cysteine--tRNA ligase [Gammaproteobacteria bacterium]MDA9123802.1 cysteine--tRNA ligase [Gammaproteobacteria bacterium]
MQPIKIFNTLSGKKEDFHPLDSNHIKIYACGPTVYNYAHIGNARMAVVFDTLVRVLKFKFDKVTYVSNITDIDDKIIDAANDQKVPINEITEKYTNIYNEDMAKLSVNIPDIQPKATQYISEMIELIEDLIKKGHAYEIEGHVLFHVPSYKNYGMLSNRNREEQVAGSRVEIAPFKKDPADFVLWKPSSDDQPGWESPWGFGRPGWHTECSAMSEKTLGLPFDIHGGGRDLTFPHHENEIAQSCCSTADINNPNSYANYWMHNGFVTINGEKMSKSLGNIILVKDLSNEYHGEVIRLALMSSHYRQGLDWNEKVIHQAKKLLDKLYKVLLDLELEDLVEIQDNEWINPLMDDLNTPGFIANINVLVKDYLSAQEEQKSILKSKLILLGSLMGILQEDPKSWFEVNESNINLSKAEIEGLISERNEAKKTKNYERADMIRDELMEQGIEIMDNSSGTSWKVKT